MQILTVRAYHCDLSPSGDNRTSPDPRYVASFRASLTAVSGALFALIATLLCGIGARDQMLVAGLARRNGQHPMLASDARRLLAAIALAMAAGELLLLRPKPPASEPTHSLGATAIVLFAQQLTDAARFIIFALAVSTAAPLAAGMGGAMGSAAVVAGGWLGADEIAGRNLRLWRIAAGALLAIAAAAYALPIVLRA
jgi:Ca2+/H+ antiporter, TMEM165/GDT1 family